MNRISVEYRAGESRYSTAGIDYMLADVDGVELYAEQPPVDGDDTGTYDDLQAEILRQAVAEGIDIRRLEWPYGEPLLTVAQAAEVLDLSETRIRQLAADGRLGRKVGRDWVIDIDSLAAEQVRPPTGRPRRIECDYEIDGIEYSFELWGHPRGAMALVAFYDQSGETFGIWTAEAEEVPTDQEEAEGFIRDLDWAVEDMTSLRREGFRPL